MLSLTIWSQYFLIKHTQRTTVHVVYLCNGAERKVKDEIRSAERSIQKVNSKHNSSRLHWHQICVNVLCTHADPIWLVKQVLWLSYGFSFQHIKDSDTHVYVHSWSSNDDNRNQNFWGRFVYNMFIYCIAILFIGVMFFCWQAFLRWVMKQSPY